MDDKYLNYEGLKKFKNLLEQIRLSDKLELTTLLNKLSADIGDGTLTIQRNNINLGNFSANQGENSIININVPTSISDLDLAITQIQNLINYGQLDVSDLTDELKEALHNRNATNNGFISKDALDTQLAVFGKIINYDSARLMILLKNGNTVLSEFSATEFLKDGMVNDVKITLGTGTNVGKSVLLIDFNIESGIADIEIPLELIFDAKNYYTKSLVDSIVSSITGESGTVITDETINDSIDNYIEGSGKQLSTNDFTNELKEKLNGIAAGAELNVQSDWNVTDTNSDAFIKNKPTIPSLNGYATLTWVQDRGYLTQHQDISGKADKSATVSNVAWSSNKLTKTINGNTSDVVTAATLKSAMELNNVGNFKAVSTAASLGLTDTEKSNARTNIGAGTGNGTITGIKMNGASKGTSGVVDLGTVITAHQDISGKLNKSGDTMTGDLTRKCTNVDASKADNNVSSTIWPTTYNVTDNSNRILTRKEAIIESNGNISAYWYVRNYNTSGTQLGQKGIKITMDKSGNATYTVDEAANFRSAIGAGTSSFSGSYNDLSNKPTIPAAANNGTYTVKTLVGSTTTNVSDFTANQSSADDVTFVQGSNVTITPDATNRKITIAAKDTTYSSKAAASGGTDVSLVTTGEKYTWNNKTSNTGTVTKVTAGTGLTGGDITTTGTIALATSGVTAGTYKRVTVDAYGRVTSGDNTDSDTKNTAGTTNKTGTKMFLTAATELSANPVTYSNSNCYIGTDNCLYSGGNKVLTSETYTGTVTGVKVGTTSYSPSSGIVTIPAYPTTLPASDVSSWAKASTKPSYNYSEIGYTATETTSAGGAISIDGTTPLQVITISAAVSGITFSAVPKNGHSCHLIITASSALSVAIAHGATMYTGYTSVCPSAEDVSLDITAGGYIELDLLRVGTKIYIRGV